jgi:hypothetical protein
LPNRRLPRPKTLTDWSAAALVAAALFALPFATLGALQDGRIGWIAGVVAAAIVLIVHAWRSSSPLVVLGAVIAVGLAWVAFYAVILLGNTCGGGSAARWVEWPGALVIAFALGALGVRGGGLRILWVTPLALVAAAAWILLAAQLVPGGAGGCFE